MTIYKNRTLTHNLHHPLRKLTHSQPAVYNACRKSYPLSLATGPGSQKVNCTSQLKTARTLFITDSFPDFSLCFQLKTKEVLEAKVKSAPLTNHIGGPTSSYSSSGLPRPTVSRRGTPAAFLFCHYYKAFQLLCLPLSLCQIRAIKAASLAGASSE